MGAPGTLADGVGPINPIGPMSQRDGVARAVPAPPGGGRMQARLDQTVAPGGYAWWYLDALSDDGTHALTVIVFIGSVFSPYYAWARRGAGTGTGAKSGAEPGAEPGAGAGADPLQHCAFNVALYRCAGSAAPTAWTMTERGRARVQRSADSLAIGASRLHQSGDAMVWDIDERAAPWPRRVRGQLRLHPLGWHDTRHALDAQGRHWWQPMAPVARVEVRLDTPALAWKGHAYLDSNGGSRTLEHDFERWHWSRASLSGRRAAVLYDVQRSDGSTAGLSLLFDAHGRMQPLEPPPLADLPASAWRIARRTRCEPGASARVEQTLEDGPFYARSLLRTHLLGDEVGAMHESLDMTRWRRPLVQAMLPFRMPRVA